jgi:hypothetical protein
VFKELRETIGIAVIALLVYLAGIMNLLGYPVLPFNYFDFLPRAGSGSIPFLDGQFRLWFLLVSVGFVIALGFRQTVGESVRGTWLLLLHRPLDRRRLIAVKLTVGTALYLAVAAAAILIYASWAATPGTHASPFFWWMTLPTWIIWLSIILCYFSVFLAGIRPGRWFGTRLLPIAATTLLVPIINFSQRWIYVVPSVVLMCAIVVVLIFFMTQERDF